MFAALLQQLSFAMQHGPLGIQCDRTEGRLDTQRLRSPYMDIRPASACWVKEQSVEMLQRFGSAFEDAAEKKYAFENLLLSGSLDALLDAALNPNKRSVDDALNAALSDSNKRHRSDGHECVRKVNIPVEENP